MIFRCPKCSSKVNELIECENCHEIGCPRCMRRSHGRWVCYECKEGKKYSWSEDNSKALNAFSSMFE